MAILADPPEIRFDGQVAVVTGAGRGLGAAYARLLAARGAAVVVHDAGVAKDGSGFDPTVADSVVQDITTRGGRAAACYENLEDAAACGRVIALALERFGRLDILIHNAGLVVPPRPAPCRVSSCAPPAGVFPWHPGPAATASISARHR